MKSGGRVGFLEKCHCYDWKEHVLISSSEGSKVPKREWPLGRA